MPTDFDENSALGRMQGASSGHPISGGLAAWGRQIRRNAAQPKLDYVTMLENQAKMHAFRSGLKKDEMQFGSDLSREEADLAHQRALESKAIDNKYILERVQKEAETKKDIISHETNAKAAMEGHIAKARANAEKKITKAKGKQERKGIKAKAEAEVFVTRGKQDIAMETYGQLHQDAGGVQNRSAEISPSTGTVKFGPPIKGVGSAEQFGPGYVNELPIAKRDDTPQKLD